MERVNVSPLIGPVGDADFGGFSGYETNGTTRHLLTDRGHLYTLSGEEISVVTLQGIDGAPLGRRWRDAEGLVALRNGRFAISFEGRHRVDIYDGTTGVIVERLPLADEFERLGGNSGLEALALSPAGELVAIAERSGASERPFLFLSLMGQSGVRPAFQGVVRSCLWVRTLGPMGGSMCSSGTIF